MSSDVAGASNGCKMAVNATEQCRLASVDSTDTPSTSLRKVQPLQKLSYKNTLESAIVANG